MRATVIKAFELVGGLLGIWWAVATANFGAAPADPGAPFAGPLRWSVVHTIAPMILKVGAVELATLVAAVAVCRALSDR
jgi:hypothetical protein